MADAYKDLMDKRREEERRRKAEAATMRKTAKDLKDAVRGGRAGEDLGAPPAIVPKESRGWIRG